MFGLFSLHSNVLFLSKTNFFIKFQYVCYVIPSVVHLKAIRGYRIMDTQTVNIKKPINDEKNVKSPKSESKSQSNQQQTKNLLPTRPNCQSALVNLSESNYASFDCDTCYALPRTPRASSWISSERLNELRKKVQEAIKVHKVFTVRGCFHTVRRSMAERNWVEKLDSHRKMYGNNSSGILIDELVQNLPQRRPGTESL